MDSRADNQGPDEGAFAVTAPPRSDPGTFVSGLRGIRDGDAIGWPGLRSPKLA